MLGGPKDPAEVLLGTGWCWVPRAGTPSSPAQLPPPSEVTVAVHFAQKRGLHGPGCITHHPQPTLPPPSEEVTGAQKPPWNG